MKSGIIGTLGWFGLALSLGLGGASVDFPSANASVNSGNLDPLARDRLRARLLDTVNEAELLIRNRSADLSDLERQNREANMFRVYDKIPLSPNLDRLRGELEKSARIHGLEFLGVVAGGSKAKLPVIPAVLSFEKAGFRLKGDQIAQEIPLVLRVKGNHEAVTQWMQSWGEELLRKVEPTGKRSPEKISTTSDPRWVVHAKTWVFRNVRYPMIKLKDPIENLPSWARKNTKAFALKEPDLWSLVLRGRELLPQAQPMTELRREFLLKTSQVEFYLAHSGGIQNQ